PSRDAPPEEETAREVMALVTDLVSRVWGHFQSRVAELDLSLPEAKAVLSLEPGQALSMRELSRRLQANPSNITVVVTRLEARGYLTRQGADDRRVRSVRLSETGLAARRRLEDRLAEDHPALRGLTSGQRETFRKILRRLADQSG